MQDRIVDTLMLVRRYAADNGFVNLTEEMDIALLIAAEEIARRESAAAGPVNVDEVKSDRGEVVVYPRFVRTGRYH